MAMLPSLDAKLPQWVADNIPADQLAEDGIETEPHVTVLYGFKDGFDARALRGEFEGLGPLNLWLGRVQRFECERYDVLYIAVESPAIEQLHDELAEEFRGDVTPSEHAYNPHLTIAYVKKGACRKLDGREDFCGAQPYCGQLLYSMPDKQGRRVFDLAGEKVGSSDRVKAAAGAFAGGHPFWGNQWTAHAQDPANDPAGEPSGKIRHAVLVIGGKRYRGPSHWQAFQAWRSEQEKDELGVLKGGGLKEGDAKEGFQTESGHFLNREQAARYAEHHDNALTSEAAEDAGIKLSASDGKLYARDAVMAAANGDDTRQSAKAVVRDAGGLVLLLKDPRHASWDLPGGHLRRGESFAEGLRREVKEETGLDAKVGRELPERSMGQQAVLFQATVPGHEPAVVLSDEHVAYKWVPGPEAERLAPYWLRQGDAPALGLGSSGFSGAGGAKARADGKARPGAFAAHAAARDAAEAEVAKAVGRVALLAEEDALAEKKKSDDEFLAAALLLLGLGTAAAYREASRRTAEEAGIPEGQAEPTEEELHEYAAGRGAYLGDFARAARDAVREAAAAGAAAGEDAAGVAARVRAAGAGVRSGRGARVADTEAQVAYGRAQDRALKAAGYRYKAWVTVGDDRVRESHELCEQQGAVGVNEVFHNGLRYPGDPNGGPEEVCNCRCVLEGVGARGAAARASESFATEAEAAVRAAELNAFDEAKHPRDSGGHWSKVKGFASRFKPDEKFVFHKPLVGPSGRALTAYEWKFKPEEYVDKQGDDRIRRVSDWDAAEESSETGRGLVHHFHVEDPDKTVRLVSSESVPALLGYVEHGQSPATVKSVTSAVKTLAKLKMKLAVVEDKLAHNDAVLKEVAKLQFPADKVASRKAWQDPNSKAQRFYLEGNEGVMQVQHQEGPATRYTLDSLEQQWRGGHAAAAGHVHVYESVSDLKRRIAKQELKIKQAIEPGLVAAEDSGGVEETVEASAFDEAKHPRGAAGTHEGGKFVSEAHAFAAKRGMVPAFRVGDKPTEVEVKGVKTVKMLGGRWQTAEGEDLPEHVGAIPPAWKHAHFHPSKHADYRAVGVDEKGRLQKFQTEYTLKRNAAVKFARNAELMEKQEAIARENEENMKGEKKEEAACLKLLAATGIRPGSDKDTGADVKAYGATTLEGRHVAVGEGGEVRLQFVGKKGVALDIPVADADVAAMLRVRKKAAGDGGRLFRTDAKKLAAYAHTLDGGSFKPKDFRTLKGTATAKALVDADPERAKDPQEFRKRVMAVAKRVAEVLGNTPAVALAKYINPFVFERIQPA